MAVQPSSSSESPAVWMAVGSPVGLLPVGVESGLLSGEITHWLGGPAGLVATIGVRTTADVAAICAGQRLWMSGREAINDELIVLEVIARQPSKYVDTSLALTGVLPIAHERRRNAVRAETRHPVRLTFDDGTAVDGVAVDLSRGGCRIALNQVDLMRQVGTAADLEIELPDNQNFSLSGEIVRTASATGELALRFQPTDIDLAPIDRLVYATVKQHNTAPEQ